MIDCGPLKWREFGSSVGFWTTMIYGAFQSIQHFSVGEPGIALLYVPASLAVGAAAAVPCAIAFGLTGELVNWIGSLFDKKEEK